ncbi:hypothetical protein [Streptomyces sp. RFCAC02]|uniref:MmyB family transcriptional regulator n=1 Tax=Streptomyces sp. RFCAC02 TaxID=2499143 RepID=UPI0010222680|nr:hypothetical protein [Streptomyces sp. RFCAC02]
MDTSLRRDPDLLALVEAWPATPALVLDERLDILAANAAHRARWGDPATGLPAERRNVLLWLASARPFTGTDTDELLRGLYEHFRSAVAHFPDDPRPAHITELLHAVRPDAAHWWNCRTVAEFRPTTVTAPPDGTRLTFALLRPVAAPGVLLLTQTPADG